MTLLSPLGLLAGLLVVPVVALHILRAQREHQRVSSTLLWKQLEDPVAPSRPWQRLRWSWPLVLQLLFVALLALALAQPARTSTASLADHTVFILDASASMLAGDGDPDRLALAKERAHALLDEVPADGSASLVVAAGEPELLLVDSTDKDAFRREIDRVRPTSGVADFAGAFTLAESAVSADRTTGWILISDGGLDQESQALAPAGTRFEAVGSSDVNRAITALSVVVRDGQLEALITMANTGGPAATQELRVDVDGRTIDKRTVQLEPGAVIEASVPIPPGSRVDAFLDGTDLLPNDNQRSTLVPLATDLRVRIASADPDGSFFVKQVLDALGAEVVLAGQEADLVIYDGVDVPLTASLPFISIASPVPPPGTTVIGAIERPIPTFVADDVVLRDVDVSRTAIAESQALSTNADTLIASAEGEPLLVRGRTGTTRWYHLAFELQASNLPVEVAYPILISRMVSDLTISDEVPASAITGTRLPRLSADAVVTSPRGVKVTVSAGAAMPILDRDGFWTVESNDGELRPVAVVFPTTESRLAIPDSLDSIAAVNTDSGVSSATNTGTVLHPLTTWLIAAALTVLLIELAVGWRKVAVPRGQLRLARAARLAVLLCLIGALLNVQWSRTNGDVRAVIVVDVSDSLGPEGSAEAQQFVAELLASSDLGEVAVVEVGRNVRVAKPFDTQDRVIADPPAGNGTDLSRGLRLAGSLLDGSTRERIVIVSDGINTTGQLDTEVERLVDRGIQLDVHTVTTDRTGDVSVESVSSPSTVAGDESYTLTAEVTADQPTRATIALTRDDEVLERRTVDLTQGMNEVAFQVTAGAVGLEKFEVRVVDASDSVPQNDAASTAVRVEGPPKVLILEGQPDNGRIVAAALGERAIDTEVQPVERFPTVEAMTAYGSVILVDVDIRQLSANHLDALDTHVRDQGNGLVVVGGTSSFALGGYAETALEDLLPVASRAEDPTRKATVAEVLLIDASESMGSCHCAPMPDSGNNDDGPFGGGIPSEGGVNKTDISRTAAARAIAALSPDDEVGVLAFSGSQEWIVPLQPVGSAGDTSDALGRLSPSGDTHISPALTEAAEALRESTQELKHIILFSDGFSPELFGDEFARPGGPVVSSTALQEQVEGLAEEGITVSVVATGEGAAPLLESLALAGNGRFYPGRDLDEIPEIFVEEARIATRSFINEGDYIPVVTSTADPVRALGAAPTISGFLAATPKDTADVMLQVGEFSDPLLSSWRVGLGKVTAWTSDNGDRWAASWAGWDGWADFWSNIVRDTFPLSGASGHQLRSELVGESLLLELISEEAWPAGAAPQVQVTNPSGMTTELEFERTSDTTFAAVAPALESGSYALAAITSTDGSATRVATAIANRSYPIEYRAQPAVDLVALSEQTGGRGEILSTQVLEAEGLDSGTSARGLRHLLLILTAILLPLDLALHRVRLRTLRADLAQSALRPGAPSALQPTPMARVVGSGR